MSKWRADMVGSSSHVHQSLWRDGANAFFDAEAEHGMSDLMRSYVAGLIKYASDITLFLAPYINSYKRFQKGSFAPTKTVWSVDNRTAGFRLCGAGTKSVRIECRIGGADLNPYLATAALLAAGLAGIEEGLELPPPAVGDIYGMDHVTDVPASLGAAMEVFSGSKMLRAAMGDWVIDHYTRAAEVELEDFDRAVTDYELRRGLERA